MKNYTKPQIEEYDISVSNIASLNDWLQSNDLTDAGITTFIVNS